MRRLCYPPAETSVEVHYRCRPRFQLARAPQECSRTHKKEKSAHSQSVTRSIQSKRTAGKKSAFRVVSVCDMTTREKKGGKTKTKTKTKQTLKEMDEETQTHSERQRHRQRERHTQTHTHKDTRGCTGVKRAMTNEESTISPQQRRGSVVGVQGQIRSDLRERETVRVEIPLHTRTHVCVCVCARVGG